MSFCCLIVLRGIPANKSLASGTDSRKLGCNFIHADPIGIDRSVFRSCRVIGILFIDLFTTSEKNFTT
jgi:hypothetical protein